MNENTTAVQHIDDNDICIVYIITDFQSINLWWMNEWIKSAQYFTRSLKERWSWIWVWTRICGCMSLLLPKLPKLPRQCYSNGPANLNNLGINDEIQPEFMCEFYHHISLNKIPRKQIQENKSSKWFFANVKHTKRHSEKQKDFVKWTLTYLWPMWTTEC